jgi:hypothetical protein
MTVKLLRQGLWFLWAFLALIVIGCTGGRGDQPVAPATSTPAPTPAPTEAARGPRIVFEQEEFDLGDLPVDQMFMVHFVYRNVGDAPLIVEEEPEVETLAGC